MLREFQVSFWENNYTVFLAEFGDNSKKNFKHLKELRILIGIEKKNLRKIEKKNRKILKKYLYKNFKGVSEILE